MKCAIAKWQNATQKGKKQLTDVNPKGTVKQWAYIQIRSIRMARGKS